MKTKLILLIACLGIFFYSCENVQNEPNALPSVNQVMVTTIDTIHEVNIDIVRHVAESYTQTTQTKSGAGKKIKEIIPVKDEAGVIAMYVVNFENNQGYIILSGSNEYQPILAFSEKGHFDVNSTDGSSVWLSEQQGFIKNMKSLPDSIRYNNKRAWNQFFKKEKAVQLASNNAQTRGAVDPDLEYRVGVYVEETLNKWQYDEGYMVYSYGAGYLDFFTEEDDREISRILENEADFRFFNGSGTVYIRVKTTSSYDETKPLLQSTWNQVGGYEVNGYPAGCVAVAMGQIMRYHRYPTLYYWDGMPYNYATNTTVSLLAEIGRLVNMDYAYTGSGANIVDACNAFKKYGYNQANIVSHALYRIRGELVYNRPVYMRGTNLGTSEGHAWVCDGYKRTITSNSYEVMALDKWSATGNKVPVFASMYKKDGNDITDYFHMNWGWGGSKDGYFYEDSVNPPGSNLTGDRQDIIGISPSK